MQGRSNSLLDLLKVYIDDESYNNGHGHAYETWGISKTEGAMAIIRPDQYVSLVTQLGDHKGIQDFFEGALLKH